MAEYIDRIAFLSCEEEIYCKDCGRRKNIRGKLVYGIGDAPCRACEIHDVLRDVDDFPAAEVVEVRRGRWNRDGRCDQCGEHAPFWCMASTYYLSNYCPGCGAKMDGGQEE